MSLYKGYKCAACSNLFEENDDVVVCPECGAPHHRSCYLEKGECALKDSHSENFKFTPEKEEEPAKAQKEPSDKFNPPKAPREPEYSRIPPEILIFGGVNPEDSISGVPVKDLAEYVGPSSGSFLRKWKMMENGLWFSLNLPAFFLGPLYYLYRKMWLLGIVYLLFALVSAMPTTILIALEQLGLTNSLPFLEDLSVVFSYISFAVNLLGGIFFNRLYLEKAKNDIQNGIKKSGVTFLAVPIFFGATTLVYVLIFSLVQFMNILP